MKILHTSDWHIGRTLFEFSLLEDQVYLFQQLYDIIEENHVDVVVIAGDLFDRSVPSAQAVSLLDEVFHTLIHKLHVKVVAVSGNHDSAKRLSYGNRFFAESGLYLEGCWSPEWKHIRIQDEYGPVNFFLLPYFIPQEVRLAWKEKSIDSFSSAFQAIITNNLASIHLDERNLLVAHGFFMKLKSEHTEEPSAPICSGSELSVGTSDLTDLAPAAMFDYVALGHLHSPQKAGCDTMRYSGSILKYSVSEANTMKSVFLLDWKEKGNLSISQIPLYPKRELRVLSGTLEEILSNKLLEGISTDDYIFANIVSDSAILNAMAQLRSVFPNALGLTITNPSQIKRDILSKPGLASLPMDELFLQFYEEIQGEPANESRKERICSLVQKFKQNSQDEKAF